MAEYRVVVVDDRAAENIEIYNRLFEGDEAFDWYPIRSKSSFLKTQFGEFDAVLLDVNLDGWDMSLGEAVNVVGGHCPIVLASQYWGEKPETAARVREVLALAKQANFAQILILNNLVADGWKSWVAGIREQLRLAIAGKRRRGLLELSSGEDIHILHLSDPQYGDPDTDGWAYLAEKEIAREVHKIEPHIHFIAITGDITFDGAPSQFSMAEEKLTTLLKAIFPDSEDWRERILLVPGNHDVNLRLAAADQVTVKVGERRVRCSNRGISSSCYRKYALQPFRDFAWQLTGDPNWRNSPDLCWVNDSFRHLGLRFYLLNSAYLIHCADPKTSAIPELSSLAGQVSNVDNPFSIAFSHHGPPNSDEDSIETLHNWNEVGKFMQTCDVRMLVHGHGHKRLATRLLLEDPSDPSSEQGKLRDKEFLRIMAPTTHLNEKRRADGASRGFSIISIKRDGSGVREVEVDSYRLSNAKPDRLAKESFLF